MSELKQWYDSIRKHIVLVLAAGASLVAVFGLDITPVEQAGIVDGLDKLVAQVVALAAGGVVFMAKSREALKADPEIATGSTTPGPPPK